MGLAAAFTVSLAMIQFSIVNNRKEVDQLYERTPVSLELVKADTTQTTTAGAFLFEETLETIVETGLIADSYVEGANYGSMFRYEETWQPGQGVSVRDQEQTKCAIRSIDSEEKFLSPFGSGQYAEIYYADGWMAACSPRPGTRPLVRHSQSSCRRRCGPSMSWRAAS